MKGFQLSNPLKIRIGAKTMGLALGVVALTVGAVALVTVNKLRPRIK